MKFESVDLVLSLTIAGPDLLNSYTVHKKYSANVF